MTRRDNDLSHRVNEHNSGHYGGYTSNKRPVELVYQQHFDRIEQAIQAERQIKGWGRAKKEALMQGDFEALKTLARSKPPIILRQAQGEGRTSG